MNIKKFICSLISLTLPLFAYSDHCGGKVDLGPVFVHIDVLESGHTIKKLDMGGFKINGTINTDTGTVHLIFDSDYRPNKDRELVAQVEHNKFSISGYIPEPGQTHLINS